VACLLKARIVKPAETAVASEWLSSRHVNADTDTLATTEELLEAVFSVRSVPRLYKEDQLSLQVSRRTQLEEEEVGVRRPPACEDVSPEAEGFPLLEDVAQQRSEDRDREH
jgi:hypothetical protein